MLKANLDAPWRWSSRRHLPSIVCWSWIHALSDSIELLNQDQSHISALCRLQDEGVRNFKKVAIFKAISTIQQMKFISPYHRGTHCYLVEWPIKAQVLFLLACLHMNDKHASRLSLLDLAWPCILELLVPDWTPVSKNHRSKGQSLWVYKQKWTEREMDK